MIAVKELFNDGKNVFGGHTDGTLFFLNFHI